ncbi:hypothetical protein DPX16_19041 [Anabarilius grahami]|uniref:Uncharacterized protein n=1 Tax=Anabarilius grahami TaxID=495550 RepID=A0A3N0YVK9_ANAGA|nr:hypothetical protein DPX16_19041 [Anabarilius grahami]
MPAACTDVSGVLQTGRQSPTALVAADATFMMAGNTDMASMMAGDSSVAAMMAGDSGVAAMMAGDSGVPEFGQEATEEPIGEGLMDPEGQTYDETQQLCMQITYNRIIYMLLHKEL